MPSSLYCCIRFTPAFSEAEWNDQTQAFEFAMRFDPHDLQEALARNTRASIDLQRSEPGVLNAVLLKYLGKTFLAEDQLGRAGAWHFIGLEHKTKHVWIYAELCPRPNASELRLQNTMLHEVAPSQINTIVLGRNADRQTLRFSREWPEQRLIRDAETWRVHRPGRPAERESEAR